MVTAITSFGRSGLYDWMMQRITALILGLYTLFIVGYLLCHPDLSFDQWKAFFDQTYVRVFSLLALLAVGAHSWIGLWQVSTDYIKQTGARFVFQAVCGTLMFVYVVWGIQVIWGL
ncbi:succinate dehydrogenase, hydrophobic membrane anchor protein [Pokkaliibacter sp. CJK22405]|uniref:succinate dehydrogenase, hydrophobic membrane anchor protein n=1 Tax=Pokkaliibacter sp. CJK22405 TaxID=3384615 RepID=UPI0039854F8D